ncbi:hypothetical protein EDB83DRAFT_2363137 [Lactarius deliciosus]|nr:hypothetical protein EDB83DRAFT_2363137 [Lactarius deliciosus]
MVTQSLEANVEASYHTPPALRIVFAGSSVPLHNRLFYPVANRYSMAHRMILVCGPDWPRAHYSESPHPTARSPRLETSTLLMVVLPPPMTSQSTSCSFSRLFASPVCGLAWRKGRMRMMVLSGMKKAPTPPHCCTHLRSQSTSLCAQPPLGTAGHATCASSHNCRRQIPLSHIHHY